MLNIEGDGGGAKHLGVNPLKIFDIAKLEGRPLFAAAPMVRYSKLAFRETVAQYGVDLCWTPMILAKEFNRSLRARDSDFTLSPESPPTICQFGANSPMEVSRATTLIAPYVNGVDINCGCPQSWACAETLGAALMNKRELVASMVKEAKGALASGGYASQKTVSVKIRIHRDLRHTIDFIRTITDAGASFLTIHGRTRSTPSSHAVNLDAIRLLRSHTPIPVLSNGDVFNLSDALKHVEDTGVDGVMAARGLLLNPAMFDRSHKVASGHGEGVREQEGCTWDVVETFMSKASRQPIPFKLVVHHLSEMCGGERSQSGKHGLLSKKERGRLMSCNSFLEVIDLLDEVREDKGGLTRL